MKNKKIVISGGSGQIGKTLQTIMPEAIYLSSKDYDLTSEEQVKKLFTDHSPIDVFIHAAAMVSGIENNIKFPYSHYVSNTLINTLLIDYAHKNNIPKFLAILSSCAYPDTLPDSCYPLKEYEHLHAGPPAKSNFAYGISKRNLATQINALNTQFGTKYSYIIPSNIYGEFDKYDEKRSHYVAALLKKIKIAVDLNHDHITLFGTGAPKRQFIHSMDAARLIKMCIDQDITESFNVCSDEEYSIDEIAKIALKACNAEHLKIVYDKSKPDGQFRKTVSNEKLKSIFPNFNFIKLEDGIADTYQKIKNNKTI